MASIPLNEVPSPVELRDLISRNWAEYRTFRGEKPPEGLRATSWNDKGNNSPSHVRGFAIDVVTPDWSDRGYLFEFGLWLALRYQESNLNVIFYKRVPQPHLHVALWSGRKAKPEASIGFNKDGAHDYLYMFPPYSKDLQGLFTYMSEFQATYTENTAQWDHEFWARVIRGEVQPPWGGSDSWWAKILAWLKKNWWIAILPVVIGIPLWLYLRNKEE